MEIYTASRRLAHWFRPSESGLGLGDYGVIGDGFTCALMGIDGSIGWLCLPRFDSPSVFASILDPARGGTLRIAPASPDFESLQAYDDVTNVLQTLFRREGEGTVVVTDSMPWSDDRHSSVHEVHRLIEVRDGTAEMEVVFDPRFDYGRGRTRVELADQGAVAEGPNGERLTVSIGGGIRFEARAEGGVVSRFRMRQGVPNWVILSWRSKRPEPIAAHRPFEYLRRTRRFWRSFSARLHYDGPWRHDVLRSALTLKLLQYEPTGALVAAPTTSLPEGIGGERNWDYRFSWTRDSAMAIRAMNLIGYSSEALGFFHFVRDCIDRRGKLDLLVTIDGGDVPQEQILDHLAGHRNSLPVRIGNAAVDQVQHDIIGPLLDATYLYERSGGVISLRLWREIRHLIDVAIEAIDEPDHGIWELCSGRGHHVHSKLMTWVALDRGFHLASRFGGDREEQRWRRVRDDLRAEILDRGVDSQSGTFVRAYGGNQMDAALLLVPIYGFLAPEDVRVQRTLDRVMKELGEGRYLRRYRSDDGIHSDEGGFVLCGFWLAEALALAGRLDEALEVFQNHVQAANHVGLLSEEVDPADGSALGNFPQAFSHLGLIQAAARLDLALRLRDEGDEHPPRHALDRAFTPAD
ncbi:MAG: glycoside hydrolase family 15 protein [Proteobacteria bacterium]|nr:glycoside hydrolase family 15 protein [Pseudomonadota bacterium]